MSKISSGGNQRLNAKKIPWIKFISSGYAAYLPTITHIKNAHPVKKKSNIIPIL